jgi:hypothetical protein
MDDTRMVRKQLYITRSQDRALKRRARELGVTEAEVIRRAIDALDQPVQTAAPSIAVAELIEGLRRLGEGGRLDPDAYDRNARYDDRGYRRQG